MSAKHHFSPERQALREKMMPAMTILRRFGLAEGQHLADLGCGQGYFTLKAAELVGPQGLVSAIDIDEENLQVLRQKAEQQGLSERISTILTHDESIPLPDRQFDRALIANVLHELKNPQDYLVETRRILKNGGEVWVIEWQKKETPMGPPLAERRLPEEWVALLEQAGFSDVWLQIFGSTHILMRAVNS